MKPGYEHLLKYREGGSPNLAIVQAFCETQEGEFCIADVESGTGLGKGVVGSSLSRLHNKGLIKRTRKVPYEVTMRHWRTGEVHVNTMTRWAYRWVGESPADDPVLA